MLAGAGAAYVLRQDDTTNTYKQTSITLSGWGVMTVGASNLASETVTFGKTFAQRLADKFPDRFTANSRKASRKGKLFIDYLRNERGATAIAPWSTRSRQGAPVAVPVSWEELDTIKAANQFSLNAAIERVKQRDPWKGYFTTSQAITKAMVSSVAG